MRWRNYCAARKNLKAWGYQHETLRKQNRVASISINSNRPVPGCGRGGVTDWRKTFGVTEWKPYRRKRFGFFKRTNERHRILLFSDHPAWSITWRRFLDARSRIADEKFWWFKFYSYRAPNGSGSHRLCLCGYWFSWSWQRTMRWPASPACAQCGMRIDENDTTYCCRDGCKMPEQDDKRAIWCRWRQERDAEMRKKDLVE